jgi:hypothetical protein
MELRPGGAYKSRQDRSLAMTALQHYTTEGQQQFITIIPEITVDQFTHGPGYEVLQF